MKLVKAMYLDGYRIQLFYDDGFSNIVDFESFLKNTGNPDNTQFRPIEKFKKFKVINGDLIWPRHEMAFSFESLRQWNAKPLKSHVAIQ